MKILMVCGNGLGSSFACQMTVETVLQELGVSASLDHCDLSSVKGMKADLILSGKNFESQFANLELTTPTIFLNRLVDKGNTVMVIEHNLDVIKSADFLIDMGPDGGRGGGELLFEGTPEDLVRYGKGYTAAYLKEVLYGKAKD